MPRNLQYKIIFILCVIAAAVYYLVPSFRVYSKKTDFYEAADQKILRLGLDLQGGVRLLLEVETEGVPKDDREDIVPRALEIIRNRIDQFGVSEPLIVRQGEKWIVVQLPGIKDPQKAIDIVGRTALLEFKLVDDKALDTENIPRGFELLERKSGGSIIVQSSAAITGAALKNARVAIGGDYNLPYIELEFTKEGASEFAAITGANINRQLAIVLDNVVQSAPSIRSRIPDGKAIIEGMFSMEEARYLAIVLRAGALPAPVKIIENRTIGPSLGSDSIKKGAMAAAIGFLAVCLFMPLYYKNAGLLADIALLMNFLIISAVMVIAGATLTLPGIAGLVLTIGMAVDANVLIFSRIREEIADGKTPLVAIDSGYEKAFSTILDANITTLIAAAFLFQFGSGPIKGFAVTLSLGIMASMFTAIFVTHTIWDAMLFGKNIEKVSI
ncbi:MAG: protein translocase subunit SecD [Candidatus Omnitrophota bacterium]|nr:protein translocase subunit SecD [Candidatus Omnitrophota bacterium]MBU2528268.1 protein translocase subunit SecD [bacterium]MBU3929645.1 protein translocase subunit SecD [bacterium]MBU4122129.1 protein translocase subunit SecD [bacterium]